MLRLLIRYAKYAGTSAFGTLVDTFVLWMLSDHVFTDGFWGEYIVSPVISFQCAVAVNYVISYFFVWKDRTRDRPDASVGRFFRLYLKYNLWQQPFWQSAPFWMSNTMPIFIKSTEPCSTKN